MESAAEEVREEPAEVSRRDQESAEEAPPRKQIYLRTVYPLNPGIPHFVDVPGSW
ncbi:MAG: hypothetical protein WD766_01635 [Gemmatimonadota bacterium]